MTFRVSSEGGEPLDLGPSLELFAVFKELAALEPGAGYVDLYAVPQLADEVLSSSDARAIRQQASEFLHLHDRNLSAHAVWILERLSIIGRKSG